ncbi:hypothetical protein M23134_07273 [Microscilla marina ATCC 23134]|uniref:Uncharacterized protein n=1 Tax=Microscilla marina ATCC 23134 TaxID=313606 RepID=A1ZVC4_MICM2|nr:hypothetical protein M23134_07273 [Microscilla marina ATCC 23134]
MQKLVIILVLVQAMQQQQVIALGRAFQLISVDHHLFNKF